MGIYPGLLGLPAQRKQVQLEQKGHIQRGGRRWHQQLEPISGVMQALATQLAQAVVQYPSGGPVHQAIRTVASHTQ
ncbi:hypothetical protein [Ferrimonas marina]|uniref:hypothetical protein n=1 Tax=Ferrimonas marina TaxID=299255 RepID=UPI00116142FE|nr:hypothetical protein [Ferrimonas marina]